MKLPACFLRLPISDAPPPHRTGVSRPRKRASGKTGATPHDRHHAPPKPSAPHPDRMILPKAHCPPPGNGSINPIGNR
jgi:hypothetical protein